MFDQLLKLVEQNAGKAIVQNDAVPNQQNNAAIREVASQIFGGLQDKVKEGNTPEVVSMFQDSATGGSITSHPMVSQLIARVTGGLASKFGISQQQANSIAGSVLPMVMDQFVKKTNNPQDTDFDLQDMLRGFTGNNNFDIGSLMDQFGGGEKAKEALGGLGKMFGK